jgi:DNA end-binding protein Ku
MAAHAFWKGYLKLSLVTCAVAMLPAVSESERVRFHTLNRKTGHRIQSRYVDAETNKVVDSKDQVRGYPKSEDEYVMLEDDELDSVALDSTHTIDIDAFVPKASIGWVWYDVPHYLVPDDEVGREAYGVIREAMRATDTVGISRVVLYNRERAVLLEPRDNGVVLWTLRYGDEVRKESDYFDAEGKKPDAATLKPLRAFIADHRADWSPKLVEDPVQNELLALIKSHKPNAPRKAAGKAKAEPARPSNVIDIREALKGSLAQSKTPRSSKRAR